MRSGSRILAGLSAAAAIVSADAARPPAREISTVAQVDLRSYSTAGRTAYAHLIVHPGAVDVVLQVAPANGVTLPLHLYTYVYEGSCANLGARTAEATRRVLGYRDPSGLWTVRNTLALGLDALRTGPHALAVRSGPADGDQLLFCGDLRLS